MAAVFSLELAEEWEKELLLGLLLKTEVRAQDLLGILDKAAFCDVFADYGTTFAARLDELSQDKLLNEESTFTRTPLSFSEES